MDYNTLIQIFSLVAAFIATVGTLTWWLAGQFKSTRDIVFSQVERVLSKLEYHEKHDDHRFQEIRNDIWEIRLRNAAIDGKILSKRRIEERTNERQQREVSDS